MEMASMCPAKRKTTILRAARSDCAELDRLAQAAFRAGALSHYTTEETRRILHYLIKVDRALIEAGRLFVLWEDDQPVGCVGWSNGGPLIRGAAGEIVSGDVDRGSGTAQSAEIRCLYVRPDRQRQGLATRLLRHAEQDAIAAGMHRFSLLATLQSVSFYASLGYRPLATAEIPMPDGDSVPGLPMWKEVSAL